MQACCAALATCRALTDVIMRGPPVVRTAGTGGKCSNVGPERSDYKRQARPGVQGWEGRRGDRDRMEWNVDYN